jgi:hypothetical protein
VGGVGDEGGEAVEVEVTAVVAKCDDKRGGGWGGGCGG